ncbi:AAA family ATPase [Puniceibacterium sediminis]|uniref:Uncharacterized protein n=1 Tax=Puniceibacterium sediminis TaxID=1608407 RepID=A0A238ZNW6_9RHOB|nr:bifunctional aminoglycoside phosphotransferase/ATP-binding protein [Puniceibacterium sediminis]SNR84869.1 hypothetical protein SAMN06265370_1364 [Puniceibacterium sediminis]
MGPTENTVCTVGIKNDDQSEAIRFLQDGAGRGAPAQRIDTHGAMIFLIGQEALKIKRAVKYDYMDLSTVEKRHAMLEREFELNRGTAPSIYKSVLPLVRAPDGTVTMGGSGDILEWILCMNRFPQEAELTQIAQDRGIGDDLAQALGTAVADYHETTPVKRLNAYSLIGEILDELDRVFAAMNMALGGDPEAFIAQSRQIWADRANDLAQRSREGHVRRCHGDLHLRNIVMIDGVPTPFDALEFDERLGTCDTLYDLAFLLMDLDHLGMTHAANLVLNAYLARRSLDLSESGLSLLPLYLSLRAAIRAMVEVQTSAVASLGNDNKRDARAYLTQALAYLEPTAPTLVAIGGYSGTGKTTIARAISHQIGNSPGAIHIRSDVLRKRLLHRDPLDRLGNEGYTPGITDRTYDAIRRQARQVLDQGHSAILDAVHGDPEARHAAEAVAKASGCDFIGIWLESSTQTRLSRVTSRKPDASDADAAVVNKQAVADPGPINWHRVDTDQPMDAVIDVVSAILKSKTAAETGIRGGKHVG